MQKRLYRSQDERMIAGVCGGLAEHFSLDPTIVRLLFVLGVFVKGAGLVAYIILAIVVPSAPAEVDEGSAEAKTIEVKATSAELADAAEKVDTVEDRARSELEDPD